MIPWNGIVKRVRSVLVIQNALHDTILEKQSQQHIGLLPNLEVILLIHAVQNFSRDDSLATWSREMASWNACAQFWLFKMHCMTLFLRNNLSNTSVCSQTWKLFSSHMLPKTCLEPIHSRHDPVNWHRRTRAHSFDGLKCTEWHCVGGKTAGSSQFAPKLGSSSPNTCRPMNAYNHCTHDMIPWNRTIKHLRSYEAGHFEI